MYRKCSLVFQFMMVVLSSLISISSISKKQANQAKSKPNIIFIFTDDQRYNTVHSLGGSELITPNLDALVEKGTSFSHAYNMGAWHGAVCVASRAMLITGLSVWDARQREKNYQPFLDTKSFWPQQMHLAGYETYMTGKWHVNTDPEKLFDHVSYVRPGMPPQTPQGYNRPLSKTDTTWQPWNEEYGGFWQGGKHWSEVLADDAIGYINSAAKKENPFFMYLAFNAPHDPRQAPKRWIDKYPLEKIKLPVSYLDDYPYKTEMGCGTDLRDEQLAPFPRTPYAVRKNIQEYYASISYLDEQIGRILKALEASGKLDNTYIIFTADHGLSVGHHGLMGKQNMFDHSLRPPLVIAGPDIPKGEKRDQQVYMQDVMATSYELAGIQKPEHVFFNSLLPIVRTKSRAGNYSEIYGCYMDLQRMVRSENYKLIVYPKAGKILLFDLKKDPQEMHDLSADAAHKNILKDMKSSLIRQQKMMKDDLDLTTYLKGV